LTTKGNNKDLKYLAAWAVAPIEEWLEELKKQGVLEGPILRRRSKTGRALGPMAPHAVWYALGERCIRAGTPIIKPHDARRTLATDLIEEHGLSKAKIALGHKNIATTAIYDMTDRNAMRRIFSEKSL
jgi:integrase/recombinase XerC